MTTGQRYHLETLQVGPITTNCYIIADAVTLQAFIIDPGEEPERILQIITTRRWTPAGIIYTHGHADHILAGEVLRELYHIPASIHRADAEFLTDPELNCSFLAGTPRIAPPAEKLLSDGDTLTLGQLVFTVHHTPGHTPGSICLQVEDLLFTGDTLFCGTVGRCDLPGGDEQALLRSLRLFFTLPDSLRLLSGHGPECLLRDELQHNPFLADH